ncbi:MAG: Nif11-like leader peptide family natural product precursor [Bacteroidota bacterium]
MSVEQAKSFIEKVGANAHDLQKQIISMERNDWEAVTVLGAELGLDFTPDELQDSLPESFFRGKGDHPDLGWDRVRFA